MPRKNMVNINAYMVYEICNEKGISHVSICDELGYSESYMNHVLERGRIAKDKLLHLCRILDVPKELIIKKTDIADIVATPPAGNVDSEIKNIKLNISIIMREQERHNKKVEEMLGYIHTIAADMLKLWEGENAN